jgi:hypothetical protein
VNEIFNEILKNNTCINDLESLILKPSTPIQLTSDLNISLGIDIIIAGVSGISMYPWPALPIHRPKFRKDDLHLCFSTVQFYVNNTPPDAYTCGPGLIPDNSFKNVSLFSTYINSINIGYGNTYGSPSQAVCPFVFKNAQLSRFSINFQVDSFLFVSLLRFQEVNFTTAISINTNISEFNVGGYNYKLDEGLLHPLVFEKIKKLYLSITIQSIQTDLFKHFKLLKNLDLEVNSLGNFYHQIGIEWMNYLNNNSFVELYSTIMYSYPDSDFCIFAQLSLNRNITINFDYSGPTLITFTIAWFCKIGKMNMNTIPCNQAINWTTIDGMLKLCNIKSNQTDQHQGLNDYPLYTDAYHTRLVEILSSQIVPFVLIPCACLIGLFFNWKIIQTINKNKKKELKEDFYKYMSANAKFNCLYCLILVFYPMTSCNWRLSTTFCSSIFTSQFVQYYKIVMIAYFGEVGKMTASISYLMMTLNRYLLVGKDHAPWLVTLAKLEFKWVIRGSLLFSVLINIGHGWQYQTGEDIIGFPKSVFTVYYGLINDYAYSDYPQVNTSTAYFIYSVVYFCISFGAFFILNTSLEVKIVRNMQKELREKRERLAKMNSSNSAAKTGSVRGDTTKSEIGKQEDRKREEEDNKKERKVIKMVVLNGIFNFVFRAPEMLFWIENANSWPILFIVGEHSNSSTDGNFSFPGILNLLADVLYFAYILTFSSNFLIFYKFNNNFGDAVRFFWAEKKNNRKF